MRWFLLVLVACSHHDEPPPPPAEPPPAPPPVQHLSADFGGCELTVAGETEKVTPTAVAVHYPPLSINCLGKRGRFSVVAPETPMGPRPYKVEKGARDYVLFARAGDKALADVDGTIDVTAFDKTHIAGTFEVSGTTGAQRVTVAGTFDFPCHGACGQ